MNIANSTGDIKNNLRKLQKLLKSIKYPLLDQVDYEKLAFGSVSSFISIYRYALLNFSPKITEHCLKFQVELNGKNDVGFIQGMYKLFRDAISYKPPLTQEQFLKHGYGEKKIIMCTDILEHLSKLLDSSIKVNKRSYKSSATSLKVSTTLKNTNHDNLQPESTQDLNIIDKKLFVKRHSTMKSLHGDKEKTKAFVNEVSTMPEHVVKSNHENNLVGSKNEPTVIVTREKKQTDHNTEKWNKSHLLEKSYPIVNSEFDKLAHETKVHESPLTFQKLSKSTQISEPDLYFKELTQLQNLALNMDKRIKKLENLLVTKDQQIKDLENRIVVIELQRQIDLSSRLPSDSITPEIAHPPTDVTSSQKQKTISMTSKTAHPLSTDINNSQEQKITTISQKIAPTLSTNIINSKEQKTILIQDSDNEIIDSQNKLSLCKEITTKELQVDRIKQMLNNTEFLLRKK